MGQRVNSHFLNLIKYRFQPQVTELRTAMLVSLGITVLVGAERIGLTGAGPIACMMAAMVSNWGWQKQGWSPKYVRTFPNSRISGSLTKQNLFIGDKM